DSILVNVVFSVSPEGSECDLTSNWFEGAVISRLLTRARPNTMMIQARLPSLMVEKGNAGMGNTVFC
ncbi:MAG: hypothetical protein OXC84_08730, partial [Gammaproteobacteria bacterium]|nr:hypothetical protein [Gammaproteobacteria bacterium]